MGLLKREKLLKKQDFKITKVDLGGGEFVYVREMSGRGRDRWERSLLEEKPAKNDKEEPTYESNLEDFRAKLAVSTVCDEKGNLLLEPEDYKVLSVNMTGTKLAKIAEAAQELNKISKEDKEDLIKN